MREGRHAVLTISAKRTRVCSVTVLSIAVTGVSMSAVAVTTSSRQSLDYWSSGTHAIMQLG